MEILIKQEDLKQILLKTNNMTPILIKRRGEILKVYITKVQSFDKIWAFNIQESQETLIFPTKSVEILRVGHRNVQDNVSYEEELKSYREFKRHLKNEERKSIYRSAVKHQFELGDGEPIK